MDSFVSKDSILIGASNHQYMLDPAIWRRFDDVIMFPAPSPALRKRFIEHQLNGVEFRGSIQSLVKRTSSYSFAQLEHILVESLKSMILADEQTLTLEHVTEQLKYQQKVMAAMNRELSTTDERRVSTEGDGSASNRKTEK